VEPDGPVREHAVQVDGGDKRGKLAEGQPHEHGDDVLHEIPSPDEYRRPVRDGLAIFFW
jgi:hypothetical protein